MNRIRSIGAAVLLALANGYVLFFYSERLWFGAMRPGDTLPDYLFTWIAYTLGGYLFLAVVRWMQVRSLAALFVAGGIFGWLIEGVAGATLYGGAGTPLPLTIVVTALQWHALVTVMVGWYVARRAFAGRSAWRVAALFVALGLLWGLWTPFEWNEPTPIVPSPVEFAAHAFIAGALLVLAYWLLDLLQLGAWKPSRAAVLVILALQLYVFVVLDILPLGWLPLVVLPLVLGAGCALLYLDKRLHGGPDLLDDLYATRVPVGRFALAFVMPTVATAVYAAAWTLREQWWHVDPLLFAGSALLGFGAFVWSAVAILRRAWRARHVKNETALDTPAALL